jgi:hypothetical protein
VHEVSVKVVEVTVEVPGAERVGRLASKVDVLPRHLTKDYPQPGGATVNT